MLSRFNHLKIAVCILVLHESSFLKVLKYWTFELLTHKHHITLIRDVVRHSSTIIRIKHIQAKALDTKLEFLLICFSLF